MIVTVCKKNTNEVLACVDTEKDSICNKEVEVIISKNEPVFIEKDGVLYLKDNTFLLKL